MFPRAHTACSLMWAWGDANREMNAGIAPPSTTALVCSDVPEAMLVRAQADSNWMGLQSVLPKKDTNFGIKPARIMLSIGGCFSLESSFLWVSKKRNKSWRWLTKQVHMGEKKKQTQQFKMPTRDQTSSYKKHNLKCILIQELRTLSNLLQWRLNAEISWNLRETEQAVCTVLP